MAHGKPAAHGGALEEWDRDEWDVLIAQEQELYLLVNDRRQSRWYLDAVYD